MSVTGEFRRSLDECVVLLEESGSAAAVAWADRLRAAGAIARADLSAAAEKVLALAAGEEGLGELSLPTAAQTESLRDRREHLLAIARVVTGRSGSE